jgi:NDP-sugar pyrophosphorylase family protein
MKMNVVIPMAGAGSRFAKNGYDTPKPLIEIDGKPMIQFVVESLAVDANYIFIVRQEHFDNYKLYDILNRCCNNPQFVFVDELTEGATCTALLAREYIDNDLPVLFANCDQYIEWNYHSFFHEMGPADGGMVTFKSENPGASYAKVNSHGDVTEVAEKILISDDATAGLYYWRRGSDFIRYAEQMIDKDIRTNNEFYLCPVYNEAIEDGKTIKTYDVSGHIWLIGTPEELDYFKFIKGFE